ncbi:MAG: hypothetical protein HYY10_02305 [Candidatus Liptonbacteria bacterium]|nr:hypothetical protein [Candidatus Liptonbacteria bacterium]
MNTNNIKEEASTSPKVALTAFQKKQEEFETRIAELERQRDDERQQFINSVVAHGWREFLFFSSYYGSHEELGEGNRDGLFLFHPSVDISRWEGVLFSHGHCGQSENNDRFEEWLSGLLEDQYIEL